jgi:hypothetical protein
MMDTAPPVSTVLSDSHGLDEDVAHVDRGALAGSAPSLPDTLPCEPRALEPPT